MSNTSEGKIGKYEVIRVLGRGGMGEVLLAEDRDLGRRVAIKRPFKSALEDGLARFQVEARAATLNHRNIPAVYELGVEDGLPFIAMEYVEGEPLDQIIASGRHLDLITKLSIIEQVCSALEHAHQKGIVHRDIKPANVIVQPDGVIKIIDFGIAKMQTPDGGRGLTQTSQIIGSLHYIAPERFKGDPVDGRSDIFSTGVMLYLLLAGSLPFPGTEATVAYKIVNEMHFSLATHIHNYPPALDGILDRALAKSPAQRYQTAEDFAEALHEVIDELKRNRVFQLFDDAERLTTEKRFEPALELLNEAIGLDPANTQVRKLRKFVREQQDKVRRVETLRELIARADESLRTEKYVEALTLLKEASALDPAYPDLREKIQAVDARKRSNDRAVAALASAEALKDRDVNGALRFIESALQEDPQNLKLLSARDALYQRAQQEQQRFGMQEIFEKARAALGARQFPQVEELLNQARQIDPSHPELDKLSNEMNRVQEQDERRRALDEIQRRVYEFLQAGQYDQASELVNRALDKLPSESTLHRLKADVESRTRSIESKRAVEDVIARARGLCQSDPTQALALVQSAIEQMPSEERLIEYEKTLREQVNTARCEDLYQSAIRQAREFMDSKQYEKAVAVLEAHQIEFGSTSELDDFLKFAREEFATRHHRSVVERTSAEARALFKDERLEEAIHSLESAIAIAPDPALTRLLDEVLEAQVALSRKIELLMNRVAQLRERHESNEAIELLEQFLAHNPRVSISAPGIEQQLNSLRAERDRGEAIRAAVSAAKEAGKQGHYSGGLRALEAATQSIGPTPELTHATQELVGLRAAHAQEAVGKSIEIARIALTGKDFKGAHSVLKSTAWMVEFADAQMQSEWNRLSQTAEQSLQGNQKAANQNAAGPIAEIPPPPPTNGTPQPIRQVPPTPPPGPFPSVVSGAQGAAPQGFQNHAPANQTPSIQPSYQPVRQKEKGNGFLIAAVCVLFLAVAAAGGFLWWKMHAGASAGAQIKIDRLPPGAQVSIDQGAPQQVDSSGELVLQVSPGRHTVDVTKDGNQTFTVKPHLNPGEIATIAYAAVPTAKTNDNPISNTSNSSIPDKGTTGPGTASPATTSPTTTALLTLQTTPKAHIVLDDGTTAIADANGSFTTSALAPGPHTVDISLKGFQPVRRKPIVLAAGTNNVSLALTPVAGSNAANAAVTKPDSAQTEITKILDAHDRFESAYASKNIEKLQSEWLDIGKLRTIQMKEIFDKVDIVAIHEKCAGVPTVSGTSAEWKCKEIVQLNKNFFGPNAKTLVFSKLGSKWVLKDK